MPRTQLVTSRSRHRRWWRTIRALWRDTYALWREFRMPILAFIIASIGGGLLYGFLHNEVAKIEPPIPLMNLPYHMVSLMVLETPESVPSEPYLIAFWYAMPAIAIYVIGRGAADFVRLFFNRSERRDAWEEAVASTYRNHVIVLGVGHVGLRVVRTLCAMGFEVVGIDQKAKSDIDNEMSLLGTPLIVGDGRLPNVLETAGLKHAQALIVCTSSDQLNLEITMRARDMNPHVRIVVRMWDNQFAKQLERFMGVQAVLSASDLAAPAFAGAAVGIEITQTLTINSVEYSMIRLQVEPGSFMDGETVGMLQKKNDMDIVLHARGDDVDVHPDGTIRVQAGDTLVIFARHSRITEIVSRNRRRVTP